jgi:molecular chaperone GrpE
MPEKKTELTVLESTEAAPGAATEEPAVADPAPQTGGETSAGRTEYDQLKAEREYATCNVIEQFLPVLDNLNLALKSTGSAHQLRSGVELIVKQMEEILRQLQVSPINAVGEEFDPRLHEALGSVERHDLPDQHVAEEIRRGYRLRERLLRPALVRIVSNSKQTSE